MAFLPPEIVAEIDALRGRYPRAESALLPALKAVQRRFRWVPPEAQRELAELLGVYPTRVQDVVHFYVLFNDKPAGRYCIDVCTNVACVLLGGVELLEHLEEQLGVRAGETTADGLFTIEDTRCLGCCSLAPVMMIDDTVYGKLDDVNRIPAILKQYRE